MSWCELRTHWTKRLGWQLWLMNLAMFPVEPASMQNSGTLSDLWSSLLSEHVGMDTSLNRLCQKTSSIKSRYTTPTTSREEGKKAKPPFWSLVFVCESPSIPLFHPAPSLFVNNQFQKCSHFHMQFLHHPSSWAFLCIHILVPQKVYDPMISQPSLSLACGKPVKLGYYSLNVCSQSIMKSLHPNYAQYSMVMKPQAGISSLSETFGWHNQVHNRN